MKYFLKSSIYGLLFLVFIPSCSVLDRDPVDRYSDAVVWSDINLADNYLKTAYRNMFHGYFGALFFDCYSDINYFKFDRGTAVWLKDNVTPDNLGALSDNTRTPDVNWSLWNNIQRLNIFISRIDGIHEYYPSTQQDGIKERAAVLKGEALFLRAECYTRLCRLWGGLPVRNEPWTLGEDFYIERNSFEETVNAIVEDCNEAASLLKGKSETTPGRASRGAALALKSRILLFAASDLTADGSAANKYVGYENPDRQALWTAAKNAAKEVIDLHEYRLANFGAPDLNAASEGYFSFFKQKTLNDDEIIWGKLFSAEVGDRHQNNLINGPNGNNNWGANNPTQFLVDSYQMEDGSDFFDHFYVTTGGEYKNKGTTKYSNPNPYYNREPRFYATILYDGAKWQKRFSNLEGADPIGVYDRKTRRVVKGGKEVSVEYGIDTNKGPVEDWNAGESGYLVKKWMDEEVIGKNEYNTNIWIYMRYPEVLLNFAEACIELNDESTAAIYINMVRNRAGLPDFEGDITAALRHERMIELAFEDLRNYDIRRWKILEDALTNAKGMETVETTNLDNGNVSTSWKLINIQDRSVSKRMYWLPVPRVEMAKAPQLTQNPEY